MINFESYYLSTTTSTLVLTDTGIIVLLLHILSRREHSNNVGSNTCVPAAHGSVEFSRQYISSLKFNTLRCVLYSNDMEN